MLLFLLTCIQLSLALSQYNFKCKPKPGCDFSQCGEIPEFLLDIEGFDPIEYRKRNQHHIICEPSFDMQHLKSDDEGQFNMEDVEEAINNAQTIFAGKLQSQKEETDSAIEKLEARLSKIEKERDELRQIVKDLGDKFDSLAHKSQQEGVTEKQSTLYKAVTEAATIHPYTEAQVDCKLKWKNKCYWSITQTGYTLHFDEAIEKCKEHGGSPANVYSETHYDKLTRYLRKKHSLVAVWIGMTVDDKGTVSLTNGQLAPFVKWTGQVNQFHYGVYTQLGLYVSRYVTSTGMYNYKPSFHSLQGVVCEK